ncbi:hypothetical protein IGI37_003409 [Enterococcus sp. AZ194]|uniref:alpha/beta hydrolase n=1 Tax=Enterococcus sp. AZ194 TaxID=2774629 RepID=UPI003F26ED78
MKNLLDGSSISPTNSSIYRLSYCNDTARPCIIIFPGGGYQHLALQKEGLDIQDWAYHNGYHSAVISYQVPPLSPENLLKDLERMIRQLAADSLCTQLYFMGFSAGAHLSCILGTRLSQLVEGLILCYPVVTLTGPYAHQGSAKNFLGRDDSAANRHNYSLQNVITAKTPPCFIWHTTGDQSVPARNSLIISQALIEKGVSVEFHLFSNGRHGMAMKNEDPVIYQWLSLVQNWLKQSGGK